MTGQRSSPGTSFLTSRPVRLVVLAATLALTATGVALAAKPYKGTVYKGKTNQNTGVRFKTSKDGKRVGTFDFGTARIQCDTSAPGATTDIRLKFGGTLKVASTSGRFKGELGDSTDAGGSIAIFGRFTSPGRAQGTVRYADRGCIGQNTLSWNAKRPPPPVKPFKKSVFKGKNSQNGNVRFRTSRDGKRVGALDFGAARVQCDTSPPGELTPQRLKFDGTIKIKNGRFKGTVPKDANEGAIAVNAKFTSRGRATGTVAYLDRGCDARSTPVSFTATRRK